VRALFEVKAGTTAGIGSVLLLSEVLAKPCAVHLATAVMAGADRFITDDRRDFPAAISEIDITYPDALGDP